MTKDYKNSGRSRPAAPKKKTAAKPTPAPKRSYGFLWGLLFGLGVAIWVYFQGRQSAPEPAPVAAPAETPVPVPAAAPATPPKPAEQPAAEPAARELPPERESRFAFYRLLNDYELLIPEEEIAVGVPEPAPTPEAAVEPPPVQPGKSYRVQVGSFQREADAENRRAQLALIDFRSSIQSVEISPGKTWHRVRIGPMTSDQVETTVQRLRDAKFKFLITQVRD